MIIIVATNYGLVFEDVQIASVETASTDDDDMDFTSCNKFCCPIDAAKCKVFGLHSDGLPFDTFTEYDLDCNRCAYFKSNNKGKACSVTKANNCTCM
jgi:hypothetical protein